MEAGCSLGHGAPSLAWAVVATASPGTVVGSTFLPFILFWYGLSCFVSSFFFFFFSLFVFLLLLLLLLLLFLGPLPRYMEVPSLGLELELQSPAYATATAIATWDASLLCEEDP